jgi:hypothetical protein
MILIVKARMNVTMKIKNRDVFQIKDKDRTDWLIDYALNY